ncbi:flippase [Lacticaseibacillus rhamnosus]|uniref:flippase n=1 Tax=Lacticaseibacillus rhamnosus TaxID=47715 RepID=UPI0004E44EC6|nr:flippase [Lacticaseibacillus rhamnosus]KFC33124.1 oligosaccharide translocase [Lacticaseibacillus rhamnosus K32]MDE3302467.1 flippase [Lacticaseibacillus rhamnosus]WHM89037.1 flippase [Lacticaseibacillus rhamnosus]
MRVIKNYFYSVGYQVLNMILPLITGPYVARVLGPKGVGINTYTGAVAQYFVLIAGLGIALYGNRQIAYVKSDRHQLSVTFWEIQLIKVATTVIAFVTFAIYLSFVHEYRFYLLLQSSYIIATGFDISWLYEGIEDFKKTFTRNTLVRIVSLVLILTMVHRPSDVWLYIVILGISNLGGYVALWPTLRKMLVPVKLKELHPGIHLRGAIILFVPYMTLNIYPVINKTLLKHFIGIDASGYFEKSDVMIRMALTIVTSVSAVLLPHTSKAYADGKVTLIKKLLKTSFGYVSMMAFPIALGLAAIAPKFGVFFYGKGFAPVGPAMMIESSAIIFMGWSSITGNQYLIPTRQSKHYTHSVLLGSLLNIILDVPLIILFGLNGAAFATLFAEAFISLYQLVVIGKQVDYSSWLLDIIKYAFSAIIMFFVVATLNKVFEMTVATLVLEIVVGAISYLFGLVLLKPTTSLQLKRALFSMVERIRSKFS